MKRIKKFLSLMMVSVLVIGLLQTSVVSVEAASNLNISFSNMGTYWNDSWGFDEFTFEFTFESSQSIYEVGIECRESDGFLKYTRDTAFSCQPFSPESVQLAVGSHIINGFDSGITYYWIAYVVHDGQRYESQTESFVFSESTGSVKKPNVDNADDEEPNVSNASKPNIILQPSDVTIDMGEAIDLIVHADVSKGTLSYQWYSNSTRSNSGGTPIRGATGTTYSPPTDGRAILYYYCVITNTDGIDTASVASNAAQVKMNDVKVSEPIVYYKDEKGKIAQFKTKNKLDCYMESKRSTDYDTYFAELALAFAAAAYDEKCIQDSLMSHGFSATDQHMKIDRYKDKFNYLEPAYAIAKKTVENNDTIVAITIRGSKSTADWLTDFGFLPEVEDGHHAGFELAMESVLLQLRTLLGDIPKNGKTKFFITGHSYGAAVANLLAVELLDRGVPKNSVYAYTFATPNVAVKTALGNWKKDGKYDCVFNVCNKMDPITYAPPSVFPMKWDKYGKSLWFDTYDTVFLDIGQHSRYKYIDFIEHNAIPKSYPLGNIAGFLAEIFCPVDVEVLDGNGDVVAKIIDGRPEYLDDVFGDVILSVDGDKKYVFLTEDTGYTIHLIGTNKGEMTYTVSEYELVEGERGIEKTFENVPLEKGKRMSSEVSGSIDAQSVRLYVTDSSWKTTEEIKGKVITSLPFTDIYKTDWYYDTICGVYSKSLMVGTSATIFEPNGNVTIAQAITMAARVHDYYSNGKYTISSTGRNNWYDRFVDYAIKNKLINSNDFTNYNAVASRAQMAYIFANVIPSDKQATTSSLVPPDVKEGNKYGKEIYLLYRTGVLSGNDNKGTFSPNSNITRAQAAAILLRVHTLLSSKTAKNNANII